MFIEDEQDLAIAQLARLRPYGWLLTGLEIIKPFGLKDEYRDLYKEFRHKGYTNQASCKMSLRFLQLEYDLDLLEVMALVKRVGLV